MYIKLFRISNHLVDNGVDEDSASSYEGLGSGSDDSHEAEDDDGSDDSPASDDDDDHLYDMDLSNLSVIYL